MFLDAHVHVSAFTPGHGLTSPKLLESLPFRFLKWRFELKDFNAEAEVALERRLARTIDETDFLDGVVVLEFDAVYNADGQLSRDQTQLYVSNDYVMELCRRNPKMLFGASIHPYRSDAVAELERCVAGGAVLVKWLPPVQNFSPADPRCVPLYEAMAHHRMPLLSHTGWEHSLPNLLREAADPLLLSEAVRRGVTVIAAHCGSRLLPWEVDYVPTWLRMAKEYENFYGDTAALNVPNRWYALDAILNDAQARRKVIHGSDWPILPVPPPHRLSWPRAIELMGGDNWMKRDILIKRELGFDDDYWHRAATILRMPARA